MASNIGQFSSQTTASMLEKVRPKLQPLLIKLQSAFMNKFQAASEKHQVSAWSDPSGAVLAWRIPVMLSQGGQYIGINLDGGDLGTGSMMNLAYMTVGTFENDIAFQIPMRAMMATKTNEQAIINVTQYTLGNAMKEMALYNEIGLMTDGTGTIATGAGTGSPAISGGFVTYNIEATNFNVNRIRGKGMLVDIYDTGNVLRYQGAVVYAVGFSTSAPTLTLSIPTGSYSPVNTDILAFPVAGGVVGTTTLAVGSWRNGIYTFQTANTTGSLLGLPYANAYELACNVVPAGGGFFTPSLMLAAQSMLIQRRDDSAYSATIGLVHPAQRASWYLQGVTISNWFRGKSDKMIDLVPSGTAYGDLFDAGGITHYCSRYANKTRVDWFQPGNFGWTQLSPIDFIQTPEGQRQFIGHNVTTGNASAGISTYIHNTSQLYSVDPGSAVVISNLAIPSGQ